MGRTDGHPRTRRFSRRSHNGTGDGRDAAVRRSAPLPEGSHATRDALGGVPVEGAAAVRAVAPGTDLRSALDNILRAGQGALIVLGDGPEVDDLLDGGVRLDCAFSGSRLYELSKLDGAIVLSADLETIRYANVHLQPDPRLPTAETGMRHRTAERVARQTGSLVIAVSERRNTVTLYRGPWSHVVPELAVALARASQALQVLAEHRRLFDGRVAELTGLEFDDLATRMDVVRAIEYGLDVLRVAERVRAFLDELGSEGRLLTLELDDLTRGVARSVDLIFRDHALGDGGRPPGLEPTVAAIAEAAGFGDDVDAPTTAKGLRVLDGVRPIPPAVVEGLVGAFGDLPRLLRADIRALEQVDGVGEVRARAVYERLRRMRASSTPRVAPAGRT